MSQVEFDEEDRNTFFKKDVAWGASVMQKMIIRLGLAKTVRQANMVLAFIAIMGFVAAGYLLWKQARPAPYVPYSASQLQRFSPTALKNLSNEQTQ